ncbi:MAG: amino acid adenylation domain-containing protein [Burkholderiales bacterium]|nr:amino acid adenylation domain-containing protein [Burkholderiales bacterium]
MAAALMSYFSADRVDASIMLNGRQNVFSLKRETTPSEFHQSITQATRDTKSLALQLELMPTGPGGEPLCAVNYKLTVNWTSGTWNVWVSGIDLVRNRVSLRNVADVALAAAQNVEREWLSPLSRLDLVSSEMRARVLAYSLGPSEDFGSERTMLDSFLCVATGFPSRIAIETSEGSLRYSELDAWSSLVALKLQEAGVSRGHFVPICFGNCQRTPVAMLAAMKCGAPFAILDPKWPEDRLSAALLRLGAKVVLGNPEILGRVTHAVRRLEMPDISKLGHVHFENVLPSPADIAYGFFTSGSTGAPKCAVNLHRGLHNRLSHMTKVFGMNSDEVVLQNSNSTFDSSLWQLLWPLTTGGKVVIPDEGARGDLRKIASQIGVHRITMTDFVPSILRILVELAEKDDLVRANLESLRDLLVGGEEIDREVVGRLMRMLPSLRVTNTYGPTEASIGMMFHRVNRYEATIPIGRPISNCQAIIVDELLQPVAQGVIGEIAISGDCLGTGYLDDDERTNKAFVKNPFSELPCPLLYLTGDLGYLQEDGTYQYVARKDLEVKIAGIRVDLTEIESVFREHALIDDAQVLVRKRTSGHNVLAAFIMLAVGNENSPDVLRKIHSAIAAQLPPYMTPREIYVVEEWPLTANGKRDRSALLTHADAMRRANLAGILEPSLQPTLPAPYHDRLRRVWKKVFDHPVVDTDDFVDLGGDSVLAMALSVEIAHEFNLEVNVGDLLVRTSFTEQARWLAAGAPADIPSLNYAEIANQIVSDTKEFVAPSYHRSGADRLHAGVLLTGATGYVGAHVLGALLASGMKEIVCVIRAESSSNARERLFAALESFGMDASMADAVVVVRGDLDDQTSLHLSSEVAKVVHDLGTIIHCGAAVNYVKLYPQLRSANVFGTQSLLHLAATGAPKRFVHISTLAALVSAGERRIEHEPNLALGLPGSGYGQSKLAAELAVNAAFKRGLRGAVFRLGEMMPSVSPNRPNPRAVTTLLIEACLTLGCYPRTAAALDFTPVGDAARMIAAYATAHRIPDDLGRYFHVFKRPAISVGHLLGEMLGSGLEEVRFDDFTRLLQAAYDRTQGTARRRLEMLIGLLRVPVTESDPLYSLFHDPTDAYGYEAAGECMARFGLGWSRIEPSNLAGYRKVTAYP